MNIQLSHKKFVNTFSKDISRPSLPYSKIYTLGSIQQNKHNFSATNKKNGGEIKNRITQNWPNLMGIQIRGATF